MEEAALHPDFTPESAGAVSLGAGELHVWAVPLLGEGASLQSLLSPVELQRAGRFRFVDHRRRYAIVHGALRAILGGYAGADPVSLEFQIGPRGKPYLRRPADVFFNLSHSSQMALIAVARSEVGIDLEKQRHLESLLDIARRHFTAAENTALEQAGEAGRLRAFYRCWTRKEAYLKAVGEGLGMSLEGFDVTLDNQPRFLAFREGRNRPEDWTLIDVSPGADYVAACALHDRAPRLRSFAFTAR